MGFNDYSPERQKKEKPDTQVKTYKKDFECLHCNKFFECQGKMIGVENCLNFVERNFRN